MQCLIMSTAYIKKEKLNLLHMVSQQSTQLRVLHIDRFPNKVHNSEFYMLTGFLFFQGLDLVVCKQTCSYFKLLNKLFLLA